MTAATGLIIYLLLDVFVFVCVIRTILITEDQYLAIFRIRSEGITITYFHFYGNVKVNIETVSFSKLDIHA